MGAPEEKMATVRNAKYFRTSGDSQLASEPTSTISPDRAVACTHSITPCGSAGYSGSTCCGSRSRGSEVLIVFRLLNKGTSIATPRIFTQLAV